MGKLPGWAKTKLAAEDNAGQVILVSLDPNSIFWFFVISFPHIFFSLRTKRGPGSPVGQKGASSSRSRCTLCHLLPAHTIDIVNNQKRVFFQPLQRNRSVLCKTCFFRSRLTRKARGWGAASIILERLFSSERTMIHLSQSWSRACLLILRLFTSNYQIVTLFLLQARLTKRPDTLDSFNDADVDDYSTQVCL